VTPPPGQAQAAAVRVPGRLESRPLESAPLPPRVEPRPAPAAVAAASLFSWPAKGRVLAEFAGPRRKGIDIDGRPGDPVLAAAAGRVTYVGTGIQGMGKLVVIKHDNGFITVYAHNKDVLVKEQQAVARGQKIAEIGSTDAERPKLHFQIRKGAAPVDPLLYLPKT
jgi:lipoprotein NlpD